MNMRNLTAALVLAVALGVTTSAEAATAPPPVAAAHETVDDTLKIMPLGDSITYGIGATPNDSYRTDLYNRLTEAGLNVDFVGSVQSGTGPDPDNEGHPGWSISQISEQVAGWLQTYQPDVILLHIGTNDMRSGATAPYAYARLSALLDKIRAEAPNAQVFVAKITGTGTEPNRPLWKSRIDRYDAQVPAVVAAKGSNFHLVNQSSISGIEMNDIVHPNAFGYSKMAWKWYRALEPVLNTSGTPWPTTSSPYTSSSGERCIDRSSGDIERYALGCHTWYLRPKSAGSTGGAWVWKTPVEIIAKVPVNVAVKVKVRVKIDGLWATKDVTRYVTKAEYRTVTKWVTGY